MCTLFNNFIHFLKHKNVIIYIFLNLNVYWGGLLRFGSGGKGGVTGDDLSLYFANLP